MKGYHFSWGTLTLIQSCLMCIPLQCFLYLFKIAKRVAQKLERIMREFLWFGVGVRARDHLVAWDKMWKPKRREVQVLVTWCVKTLL